MSDILVFAAILWAFVCIEIILIPTWLYREVNRLERDVDSLKTLQPEPILLEVRDE